MKKVYVGLVCGSLFLGSGFASAVPPNPKGLTQPDVSISQSKRTENRPVLLAAAETGGSESSTRSAYLQTVGSALQAADATPSPLSQPATHTLLLAGLTAVLYVALRRRPRP
jgi:hypothetical protein